MSQEKGSKKLFMGNLDQDVEEKDIEERFSKYGKIAEIKLKKNGQNCFGFLEFEDALDAQDALKEDNCDLKGKRMRIELGNGGRKKRTEGCFTCGSLNHIARDCNKNSRRDGGRYNNNRRSRSRSNDRKRRNSRSNDRDRKRDNFNDRRRESPREDRYSNRRDAPTDRRRRSSRSDSRDKNRRPYENKRRSPDQYESSNNGFRDRGNEGRYERKPRDSSPAGYQSKYNKGDAADSGKFSNGFSNGGSNNYGSDSRYASSRQDSNYRTNNTSYNQQPRSNSR